MENFDSNDFHNEIDGQSWADRTKKFNELDVTDRKQYLNFLADISEDECDNFVDHIRKQAVQDFWDNERTLIQAGKSTENWTPEQIEHMMNFNEDGTMKKHARAAMQVDANGKPVLNSAGNYISYEGHHMLNVDHHPEYAGDWRNVQALSKKTHLSEAHQGGTKMATNSYYDPHTKTHYLIDDTIPVDFNKVKYVPEIDSIFKSDELMRALYPDFDSLNDAQKFALKYADESLEFADPDDYLKAIQAAEKWGFDDINKMLGTSTVDDMARKYGDDFAELSTAAKRTAMFDDALCSRSGIKSVSNLADLSKHSSALGKIGSGAKSALKVTGVVAGAGLVAVGAVYLYGEANQAYKAYGAMVNQYNEFGYADASTATAFLSSSWRVMGFAFSLDPTGIGDLIGMPLEFGASILEVSVAMATDYADRIDRIWEEAMGETSGPLTEYHEYLNALYAMDSLKHKMTEEELEVFQALQVQLLDFNGNGRFDKFEETMGLVMTQTIVDGVLDPDLVLKFIDEYCATEAEKEKMREHFAKYFGDIFDSASNAQPPRDPLAIDLGAEGIELVSLENGVNFDLDKNDFRERTAWIGREDGFLALDRNGNGAIDDGGELFGDQVTMKDGTTSTSGFEALAELDENSDGVIDNKDAVFSDLRVWVDANQNGQSEAHELKTLEEMGVVSISLDYTETDITDEETGTRIAETADVTIMKNGVASTTSISEFWFPVDTGNTTQGSGEEIIATTGNVSDLMTAIAKDETGTLAALYEDFCTAVNIADMRYALKQILYFVTEATDINPNARGGNIDARDLKVIEAFMGREFVGVDEGSSPNSNAATILKGLYTDIENYYFNTLIQLSLKGFLDGIFVYTDEEGNVSYDMSLLKVKVGNILMASEQADGFIYALGSYIHTLDKVNNTSLINEFTEYCVEKSAHYADVLEQSKAGNTFLGTDNNDNNAGTNGNDFIFGGEGNDTLSGGNGKDFIFGDVGSDTLRGGNGDDLLNGGNGNDTLYGDAGNDTLYGGNGLDKLYGGAGNDVLYGEINNDTLDGGAGDDVLHGGIGEDIYVFAKGYGKDIIIDNEGTGILRFTGLNPSDILVNGTGENDVTITIKGTNDTLTIKDFRKGEEYADFELEFANGVSMHVTDENSPFRMIYGTNGDDTLIAVVDGAKMYGFDGDDTIIASEGADLVYGGNGNDVIDTKSGDDFIFGGEGDDTITAGAGNNVIYADGGNNTVDSGEGNDLIIGDNGDDTYVFGTGYGSDIISDNGGVMTITFLGDTDALRVYVVGADLILCIDGTDDRLIIQGYADQVAGLVMQTANGDVLDVADYLVADTASFIGAANSYTVGSEDNDVISGTNDYDMILGGEGDDYISGNAGNDRLIGEAGNDQIFGGTGNDSLFGDEGDDVLLGGDGDDYISGGADNDFIDGGFGNDFMDGSAGDDTYIFRPGYGTDCITDMEGKNTIIFGDGFTASGLKAYRHNWNDLLITFEGSEDKLILKNYCIDENARDYTLVFGDGTVVHAVDPNSPLRTIYGTETSEYLEDIYGDGVVINTDSEADHAIGGAGNDTLRGSKGDDRIVGNGGNDLLDGGTGNDLLYGGEGNDTYVFKPGYGVDTILDSEGLNTISIQGFTVSQVKAYRTNWNDLTITFAGSEDQLVIKDFFVSSAHRNFNIVFNNGSPIHANASNSPLRTLYGTSGDDHRVGVDDNGYTLYGETGNDNVNGAAGNDKLYGGIGNDTLNGNGGNDTLDGGIGNDKLYGGAGNDTYIFSLGYGNDTIVDKEGLNTIQFGSGITLDRIKGIRTGGNDLTIMIEGTEDKLVIEGFYLAATNRNFNLEFANGTKIAADSPDNPLKAIRFSDNGEWQSAPDDSGWTMHGGTGNDGVVGGNGNDILDGGAGNDTLSGGNGDDTYVFGKGYGMDTIDDWSNGSNVVSLKDINSDEVVVTKLDSGALELTINGTNDKLTINGFMWTNATYTFEFADGMTGIMDKAATQAMILIDNMASFGGESNVSWTDQSMVGAEDISNANQLLVNMD